MKSTDLALSVDPVMVKRRRKTWLASISEIKERKNKKSNLDLNIFKAQAGGASSEIKQKLRNMGIHSSSTDSLCE